MMAWLGSKSRETHRFVGGDAWGLLAAVAALGVVTYFWEEGFGDVMRDCCVEKAASR